MLSTALLLIHILVLLARPSEQALPPTRRKTRFLIEIFRHGARREVTSIKPFVDPVPSPDYPDTWKGMGDLSTTGDRQHYLLGRSVRQAYAHFLPTVYDGANVRVMASSFNRTIESLQAHLAGLFDLGSGGTLNFDDTRYFSPPIAGFTHPLNTTDAIPGRPTLFALANTNYSHNFIFTPDDKSTCPRFNEVLTKYFYEVVDKFDTVFAPFYQLLKDHRFDPQYYYGKDAFDFRDVNSLCDNIISRSFADPTFSVDNRVLEGCLDAHAFAQFAATWKSDVHKTFATTINRHMTQLLTDLRDGKNSRLKMVVLSGHDSTVATFLNAFFPDNYLCILDKYRKPEERMYRGKFKCLDRMPYTANIIVEVYSADGDDAQLFVEIKFNGEHLVVSENDHPITLEKFLEVLADNTGTEEEFRALCNHPTVESDDRVPTWMKIALLASALFVVLLLAALLVISNKRAREPRVDPILQETLVATEI